MQLGRLKVCPRECNVVGQLLYDALGGLLVE